jgi:glutamine---fructose-6-phosphate transaminase (isomerizing)
MSAEAWPRVNPIAFYTRTRGPEIAVASTKAFSTQVAALNLLALFLGKLRARLSPDAIRLHARVLCQIPDLVAQFLERSHLQP